jgi:hypothetical protein
VPRGGLLRERRARRLVKEGSGQGSEQIGGARGEPMDEGLTSLARSTNPPQKIVDFTRSACKAEAK